jgi:hypothetical protein
MSFGSQSQQIEFGSHSLVIDGMDRKVRVFSDLDTPKHEFSRDWQGVSEKLSELGVRELSELPSENRDSVTCAEGEYPACRDRPRLVGAVALLAPTARDGTQTGPSAVNAVKWPHLISQLARENNPKPAFRRARDHVSGNHRGSHSQVQAV